MQHLAEGTLQAYVDRELDSREAGAVEGHLAACRACSADLGDLRRAAELLTAVLRGYPAERATGVRPHPAFLRTRAWRRTHQSLLKAAAVITLLFASAALLEATTGWVGNAYRAMVSAVTGAPAVEPVADSNPAVTPDFATTPTGLVVTPLDGRIEVHVLDAAPGALVRVRLVDSVRATVNLGGGIERPHFRAGPGTATVRPGDARTVDIALPRGVSEALVRVNGAPYVVKLGEDLRFLMPPADTAGAAVEFRVPAAR